MKIKQPAKWILLSIIAILFARFLREQGLEWLERNIYKFTKSTEKVLVAVEKGATLLLIILLVLTAITIYLEKRKTKANSR